MVCFKGIGNLIIENNRNDTKKAVHKNVNRLLSCIQNKVYLLLESLYKSLSIAVALFF